MKSDREILDLLVDEVEQLRRRVSILESALKLENAATSALPLRRDGHSPGCAVWSRATYTRDTPAPACSCGFDEAPP
jgi:hypothetical protein